MSDNRVAPRSRTFLPARIEIAGLGTVVNCTIRDISETGARIQVAESATLPVTFSLHIPKFDRVARVTQRWRHGDKLGVEFAAAEPAAPVTPEEKAGNVRYVKKLEDEIVRLKLLLEAIREDPMKARMLLDHAA